MVCPRNKYRIIAFHAVIADHNILQIHVQGMADVQVAIGVGRRHDDGVRFADTGRL